MAPDRRTALVAGVLYLVTFLASIPALLLIAPVLDDPAYVLGDGTDTRVLLGALLDLVNAAACVGTAVALYPVIRRHGEARSLGFVTARMAEAAIIVVGVLGVLTVVTLRQDVGGPTAADPASVQVTATALVTLRDWTFLLGPGTMAGVNALLLGSVLFRARLVPRLVPAMGLLGAPLILGAAVATFFGLVEQLSVWSALATAPIAAWELSLGICLVVKGFRSTTVASTTHDPGTPVVRSDAVPVG
ncbi:MAG TPA: DUF4386 domain-containing protein [Ornithinibacter sp.]|nr:DUF4386 domain-containing protein [Ornithinibacter sp.]